MSKIPKNSLFSRYSVTIIMIPSIIGIHYGWYLMQKNRALVREDEQMELPAVKFAKYCWSRLTEGETSADERSTAIINTATK